MISVEACCMIVVPNSKKFCCVIIVQETLYIQTCHHIWYSSKDTRKMYNHDVWLMEVNFDAMYGVQILSQCGSYLSNLGGEMVSLFYTTA